MALVSRGWRYGHNIFYLAFPLSTMSEPGECVYTCLFGSERCGGSSQELTIRF
jgi:hypothetical protein